MGGGGGPREGRELCRLVSVPVLRLELSVQNPRHASECGPCSGPLDFLVEYLAEFWDVGN